MRDIHCHIVFGVDDGSQSLQESIEMLRVAKRAGITSIVATPHCRGSHFSPGRIRRNYEELKRHAQGIQLRLGYEVYYNNLVQMGVEKAHDFSTEGTNELLLELPLHEFPFELERTVFELRASGLQVIIAHPERYEPVQKDIRRGHELVDMGCELQLSANCLTDSLLSNRKRCAKKLLKEGLVSYIASDAHCADDYRDFNHIYKKFRTFI